MMGPVHDTNIIFYLLYRRRMAKVRKLKMKQCTVRNGKGDPQPSAGRLIKHGPVPRRSSFGAWTVIVRCPDGHRSVPRRSSFGARTGIGRFVKSFFQNLLVLLRHRTKGSQALYGARTVAVEIVRFKF